MIKDIYYINHKIAYVFMNTDFAIDKNIGICIVHANYEGIRKSKKSKKSNSFNGILSSNSSSSFSNDEVNVGEIDSIVNTFDSIKINETGEQNEYKVSPTTNVRDNHDLLDFSNTEPDKFRINVGTGFLVTIMGERFVITCSHIMIKSAVRYTAFFKIDSNVNIFDLEVYFRIPEIDMIIMKFANIQDRSAIYESTSSTSHLSRIPDLIDSYDIKKIREYQNNNYKTQNQILTAIYDSDNIKPYIRYDTIDLNNLDITYSTLVTSLIDSVPNISIPIDGLGIFTDIEKKYNTKIETIMDYKKNANSRRVMNKIIKRLRGLSGSIIISNSDDSKCICIGMIVTFSLANCDNVKTQGTIKSIPMDVILTVADNCIRKRINKLMGVHIDFNGCIAEEGDKEFYAAIVRKPSSRYINGKKDFWFSPEDMILGIDQMDLDRSGSELVLNTENYGNKVPINSYMFYKSNTELGSELSITISKIYDQVQKKINFNIKPIPYNDMYVIRMYHQKEILWRGYLFLELSEELLRFYKHNGINLLMGNDINEESMNGEKIVILFNYNNTLPSDLDDRYMNLNEYTKMPCKTITGNTYFFYQLERISNRVINHIEELDRTTKDIEESGQKKITIVLKNRSTKEQIKLIM